MYGNNFLPQPILRLELTNTHKHTNSLLPILHMVCGWNPTQPFLFSHSIFLGVLFSPSPPFFSLLLISSYYYPPFSAFSFHLLSFPSYISPIPLINTLLCSCTIVTHLFHTHVHLRLAHHHLPPSPTTNTTTQGTPSHVLCFKKNICWRIFKLPNHGIRYSSISIVKELKEFFVFFCFLFFNHLPNEVQAP